MAFRTVYICYFLIFSPFLFTFNTFLKNNSEKNTYLVHLLIDIAIKGFKVLNCKSKVFGQLFEMITFHICKHLGIKNNLKSC